MIIINVLLLDRTRIPIRRRRVKNIQRFRTGVPRDRILKKKIDLIGYVRGTHGDDMEIDTNRTQAYVMIPHEIRR
jgi:hypothetical protein